MHHGDLQCGQWQTPVAGSNARIVPHRDLAEEDVGQHIRVQLHRAGCDAWQVERRHDAADDRRKLPQAGAGQFCGRQWFVGRTKIHGASLDLGDAAAGADGLIVHFLAGGCLVVRRPLGHGRVHKRCACAGDIGRECAGGKAACQYECSEAERERLGHEELLSVRMRRGLPVSQCIQSRVRDRQASLA